VADATPLPKALGGSPMMFIVAFYFLVVLGFCVGLYSSYLWFSLWEKTGNVWSTTILMGYESANPDAEERSLRRKFVACFAIEAAIVLSLFYLRPLIE
jgi:hypothetical protein